jgi:hypothetical protein
MKQRRRILIATHLLVHTITLSLISTVLLLNVLPSAFAVNIPYLSQWRHTDNFEREICQELDQGFGWDERWFNDCASSFDALSRGVMCAGLVMMAAQWLVLISLGHWLRQKPTNAYRRTDLEKRQGSSIVQDYKK